jgi:hypothetical protein
VRLLLDEMFSPVIARRLRERGHDVLAVKERPDWQALPDADVLSVARRERRAVVTDNLRDYRPLHHEAVAPGGSGHFGMVFVPGGYRRAAADIGRIVKALETNLAEYPRERDLADGETWL